MHGGARSLGSLEEPGTRWCREETEHRRVVVGGEYRQVAAQESEACHLEDGNRRSRVTRRARWKDRRFSRTVSGFRVDRGGEHRRAEVVGVAQSEAVVPVGAYFLDEQNVLDDMDVDVVLQEGCGPCDCDDRPGFDGRRIDDPTDESAAVSMADCTALIAPSRSSRTVASELAAVASVAGSQPVAHRITIRSPAHVSAFP